MLVPNHKLRVQPLASASPCLLSTFRSLPPVYDIIFDHLSALNLIRVSLTCKDGLLATNDYKQRTFSINQLLSRFFNDPLAFRSLQARTGTLISGSQALQFFSRRYWSESDLDIYAWPEFTVEIGMWLLKEGYQLLPNHPYTAPPPVTEDEEIGGQQEEDIVIDQTHIQREIDSQRRRPPRYAIPGLQVVLAFEKQLGVETLRIQVIGAMSTPIEIILKFHSST
jgi:hypothetical protein